jgi:hypothetical protein
MIYRSIDGRDGLGSHVQQYVFGLMYAALNGHSLYLSYDTSFEHNYDGEADYTEKMLKYINLHKYYGMPPQMNERAFPQPEGHYKFCEQNLDRMLGSAPFKLLKSRFLENKPSPFDSAFHNVAVHIRRFNAHDNRVEGSDTPNRHYLNVMNRIRDGHDGTKPLKFHIYSQGKAEDFADLAAPTDVEFHINGELLETYNGMLLSDSLVLSRSSFSYSAALLTDAKVYYTHFWHPPASHWVVV